MRKVWDWSKRFLGWFKSFSDLVHIIHKFMFLSERGVINCLKSLNNHLYGQNFNLCFQFQPKFQNRYSIKISYQAIRLQFHVASFVAVQYQPSREKKI